MEIPANRLSAEALRGLAEEFVTREGTDYGEEMFSLDVKIKQVLQQIHDKAVVIRFDPNTQTCSLFPSPVSGASSKRV